MSNIVIYSVPNSCNNLDTHVLKFCLPPTKDCTLRCLESDIALCDELWNCNLCQGEIAYLNPWTSGDKIQFQFQFIDTYNADHENPANGWGSFVVAELCNVETGAVVSIDHTLFSDCYLAGWNGEASYQVISIDTSLPIFNSLNCWNLRVTSYNSSAEAQKVFCTEPFGLYDCTETMTIKGDYTAFDCCERYYGDPVAYVGNKSFRYNNQRRYYGFILDEGTRVTKERFGDKIRDIEVNTVFLLKLVKLIPPYVKNTLLNLHLSAEVITIDEIEYRADSYSVENENRQSRMFFFDVELIARCELTPGCN